MKRLSVDDDVAKILTLWQSIWTHNYCFSDLYLAEFLDSSTKPFFPYNIKYLLYYTDLYRITEITICYSKVWAFYILQKRIISEFDIQLRAIKFH